MYSTHGKSLSIRDDGLKRYETERNGAPKYEDKSVFLVGMTMSLFSFLKSKEAVEFRCLLHELIGLSGLFPEISIE